MKFAVPLIVITLLASTVAAAEPPSGIFGETSVTLDTAQPPPKMTKQEMIVLRCVYSSMKSYPAALSVSAYAVGGFRSAVEYSFYDGNSIGKSVIMLTFFDKERVPLSDLMSDGIATYSGTLPTRAFGEEMSSKCKINPAFDNLLPPPNPRAEWQSIIIK